MDEERWLNVGEAARWSGRDPSTIRRWADEGKVLARRSPGGHRQIALSSLIGGHDRPITGGPITGGDASAPPHHVLAKWAAVTEGWVGWSPPQHLSDDDLAELQVTVADVRRALDRMDDTIAEVLRERDLKTVTEAASDTSSRRW